MTSQHLQIERHGAGYLLQASIEVRRGIDEVFSFFADARNLEQLTPAFLRFRILTELPIDMRPGTLIDYQIKVRGVPMRWRTRIAAFEPPFRFVDEQLRGPYRRWSHEHRFESTAAGTLCLDRVEYQVFGGGLVHWLLVRRDVERIFAYRAQRLAELFGCDTF